MKKIIITIAIVLLVIVLLFSLLVGGFFWLLLSTDEEIRTDITQYSSDLQGIGNAEKMMPSLNSLGDYTEIEYTYKIRCYSALLSFYSDAYALFVTYDKKDYDAAKNKILTEYTFLQEPLMHSEDSYTLPVTEFNYKGFDFKIVPDEAYYSYAACKSFMMIGFNEEASKIVYMYYYDYDIDLIAEVGENLEEEMYYLIDSSFHWPD